MTDTSSKVSASVNRGRTLLARVIALVTSLCALVLFVGALCVVFGANEDNALVAWVLDTADWLDLGVFGREGGIKEFTGKNHEAKNAILNWGLAALVWLVAGRIVAKVVRP
jgi:hypothetical protein